MNNIFEKENFLNLLKFLIPIILLFLFFYKVNFENFIPVTGDELSSILVFSSNIKTVFLKNFPNNVTFFNFLGYLKTLIFGYELISYRTLTFLFLISHFWILKKLGYQKNLELIYFILILTSNSYSFYAGQYAGYIFSSFIFVLIFYLIKKNLNEKNNKFIFLLLFLQVYNHLVNIYLVGPIILSLFFFSNKKKFIYDFLLYYLLPVLIFYFFSIILTGLAVLKVSNTDLGFILMFFTENYQNIFINGFNRIFFYEAYINAESFKFLKTINDIIIFDQAILAIFILCFIFSFINLGNKNKRIFSLIIFFHILIIFLIDKNPAPRIFVGFYCFYIFMILDFIHNQKTLKNFISHKINYLIFLTIIVIQLVNFDYFDKIPSNNTDFNFSENKISINYLKKNCILVNKEFSEIQKRNYYFNYLNICKKKFQLSEFLNYYRS